MRFRRSALCILYVIFEMSSLMEQHDQNTCLDTETRTCPVDSVHGVQWPETKPSSCNVSDPICINKNKERAKRCCDSCGEWVAAPTCDAIQNRTLDACPKNSIYKDDICIFIVEATSFPYPCPYEETLSFEKYVKVIDNDILPIWMPVIRHIGRYGIDIFRWNEAANSYKLPFNSCSDCTYSNATHLAGEECVVFHNSSYIEPASCDDSYNGICAYKILPQRSRTFCSQNFPQCRQSDYTTKSKCYCLRRNSNINDNITRAEFVEPYQNLVALNLIKSTDLTEKECYIGLAKENTYFWTTSREPIEYTYWSSIANFDEGYSYGALSSDGWILKKTGNKSNCVLYERELIQEVNSEIILSFNDTSNVFSVNVTYPNYLAYSSEGIPLIYCFTDACGEINIDRVKFTGSEARSVKYKLFYFGASKEGPGMYWCEALFYPNMKWRKSNEYFQSWDTEEYVVILNGTFDSDSDPMSVDTIKYVRNKLYRQMKELSDVSYFTPRIYKIINIDEANSVLTMNFHLTRNATSVPTSNYNVLRNFIQSGLTEFQLVDFLSTDYCVGIRTYEGNQSVTWPMTRISEISEKPVEGWCTKSDGIIMYRRCVGDFINGARWSQLEEPCIIVSSTNITINLTNIINLNNPIQYINQVSELLFDTGQLSVWDIQLLPKYLDQLANLSNFNLDLAFKFIDKVMDAPKKILYQSQILLGATDKMLSSIENLIKSSNFIGEVVESNFRIFSELVAYRNFSAIIFESNSSLKYYNTEISDIKWNTSFDTAIILSNELLQQILTHTLNKTRIIIISYDNSKLFNDEHPTVNEKTIFSIIFPDIDQINGSIISIYNSDSIRRCNCSSWKYVLNSTLGHWRFVSTPKLNRLLSICFSSQFDYIGLTRKQYNNINITLILNQILSSNESTKITLENIFSVVKSYTEYLTPLDIYYISNYLIMLHINNDDEFVNYITLIDNIIDIDPKVLEEAESLYGVTNSILESCQEILENSENTRQISRKNIHVIIPESNHWIVHEALSNLCQCYVKINITYDLDHDQEPVEFTIIIGVSEMKRNQTFLVIFPNDNLFIRKYDYSEVEAEIIGTNGSSQCKMWNNQPSLDFDSALVMQYTLCNSSSSSLADNSSQTYILDKLIQKQNFETILNEVQRTIEIIYKYIKSADAVSFDKTLLIYIGQKLIRNQYLHIPTENIYLRMINMIERQKNLTLLLKTDVLLFVSSTNDAIALKKDTTDCQNDNITLSELATLFKQSCSNFLGMFIVNNSLAPMPNNLTVSEKCQVLIRNIELKTPFTVTDKSMMAYRNLDDKSRFENEKKIPHNELFEHGQLTLLRITKTELNITEQLKNILNSQITFTEKLYQLESVSAFFSQFKSFDIAIISKIFALDEPKDGNNLENIISIVRNIMKAPVAILRESQIIYNSTRQILTSINDMGTIFHYRYQGIIQDNFGLVICDLAVTKYIKIDDDILYCLETDTTNKNSTSRVSFSDKFLAKMRSNNVHKLVISVFLGNTFFFSDDEMATSTVIGIWIPQLSLDSEDNFLTVKFKTEFGDQEYSCGYWKYWEENNSGVWSKIPGHNKQSTMICQFNKLTYFSLVGTKNITGILTDILVSKSKNTKSLLQETRDALEDNIDSLEAAHVYLVSRILSGIYELKKEEMELLAHIISLLANVPRTILEESQKKYCATDRILYHVNLILQLSKGETSIETINYSLLVTENAAGIKIVCTTKCSILPLDGDASVEDIIKENNVRAVLPLRENNGILVSANNKVVIEVHSNDALFNEGYKEDVDGIIIYAQIIALETYEDTPLRFYFKNQGRSGLDVCAFWDTNFDASGTRINGHWAVDAQSQNNDTFSVCDFRPGMHFTLLKFNNVTNNLIDILNSTDSFPEKLQQAAEVISVQYERFASIDVSLVAQILGLSLDQENTSLNEMNITSTIVNSLSSLSRDTLRDSQTKYAATDKILFSIDEMLKRLEDSSTEEHYVKEKFAAISLDLNASNISGLVLHEWTKDNLTIETVTDSNVSEIINKGGFKTGLLFSNQLLDRIHKNKLPVRLIVTLFYDDSLFNEANGNSRVSSIIWGSFFQVYPDKNRTKKGSWKPNIDFIMKQHTAICEYDHITHFALLLGDTDIDFEDINKDHILDIITAVNSMLSMVGLIGIVLTAILFERWRKNTGNQILLNFSFAISIKIVMLYISNEWYLSQKARMWCYVIGGILHYAILSEFFWMLIIAVLQFKRFVEVLGGPPKDILLKACICGWVFPAVPVLLIAVIDVDNYAEGHLGLCYPSGLGLYLGIWLPLIVIILINTVIFSFIIYNVCHRNTESREPVRHETLFQWRLALLLFSMLGLTWLFGFLSLVDQSSVSIYIFCFLATLQGFIMFLFFIIYNKNTRFLYKQRIRSRLNFKSSKGM